MRYVAMIGLVVTGIMLAGCKPKSQDTVSRQAPEILPLEDLAPGPTGGETTVANGNDTFVEIGTTDTDTFFTPPPAPRPTHREYTIQRGDKGFMAIARGMLGDVHRWREIRDLNPGVDTRRLRVGQRIRIPVQ